MFQAFGGGVLVAADGAARLCRGGLLLSLFERFLHAFDSLGRLALGIDRHLRAAFTGRLHLGALPLGTVGVPLEEVHLAQREVGLDPCVERFALTVFDHALDVERLDVRTLGGVFDGLRPLFVGLVGNGGFENHVVDRQFGSLAHAFRFPFATRGALLRMDGPVLSLIAFTIQSVVGEFKVALGGVDLNIGVPLVSGAGGIALQQHLATAVKVHPLASESSAFLMTARFSSSSTGKYSSVFVHLSRDTKQGVSFPGSSSRSMILPA